MQGDFCVTYSPIEGSIPSQFATPRPRLDSTPFLFAFISLLLWGVCVVVAVAVDSCGCVVSARNKYAHHANSLAHAQWSTQYANQTQIQMSIKKNNEYIIIYNKSTYLIYCSIRILHIYMYIYIEVASISCKGFTKLGLSLLNQSVSLQAKYLKMKGKGSSAIP